MTKILLVEDDRDILDLAAYFLRRERFLVVDAADGPQAIRRWEVDRPDLVVLDLGLPGLDGFEVVRRIREADETPILVLTGRKDSQAILRCFDLGIDDFMSKPFEFSELTARIRAILRRARRTLDQPAQQIELDGLCLDPEANEATWRDARVRLTPTEFRILYVLATSAGHVVPVNRLYTYVWGSEGGEANALRSHISHLRRKLAIHGPTPGTITAIPAVGYVFRRVQQIEIASPGALRVAPTEAASPA